MKGTLRDEAQWSKVQELLRLNPGVTFARIGREVGTSGQQVGLIARASGFPPRRAGGFKKKDESQLVHAKKVEGDGA